jgi:LysR family transcriptional regulator, glycine cleavage system transcriptional activator
MSARLPPLNALRTFEAAARLLSFTKAAEELFVTQAAVSHQIKTLEEHLGVALFRRLNRGLMLTDHGQLLLPAVRQAFDTLAAGVERMHEQCCRGALTISTTPSFAANWLARRLGRFQALWPDFEISLTATPRLVEFVREGIDCGVRYGFGDWPGLRAERLFGHELVPVCSPVLLEGGKPLRRPDDLRHHTLLHVLSDMDDWRLWLRAAEVAGIDPTRGLKFDTGPLALAAAMAGAGIAITHRRLVDDDLAAGRLVELFDFELPIESAYYFIAPDGTADLPKVALFRDWILAEARAGDGQASTSSPASQPAPVS